MNKDRTTTRTVHGIDLTAPGGIEALLAFNRARFGGARMEATGDGGGGDGGQQQDGQQGQQNATQQAQTGDQNNQQGRDRGDHGHFKGKDDNGLPDDPAALKALIADLRKENGNARTNAKAQAADEARQSLVNELGKALGLVKDGDSGPTPEQLTEQLGASQKAAQRASVELAVYRAAATAGADAERLLDSRRFIDSLADVDPTDSAAVTKAITTAVAANPQLKTGRAPGASSVDHGANSSGESAKRTPRSLDDAVRSSYGTA